VRSAKPAIGRKGVVDADAMPGKAKTRPQAGEAVVVRPGAIPDPERDEFHRTAFDAGRVAALARDYYLLDGRSRSPVFGPRPPDEVHPRRQPAHIVRARCEVHDLPPADVHQFCPVC